MKTTQHFISKYAHRFLYILIAFLISLSFVDCAKKGSPTGGKKDSIPPVIVRSEPENYSINFDDDEIKIYFDEYIKLKDLNKNLLISPPFNTQPTITPLSTSKVLKIKFNDTLKDNTTYVINFGQSIVDNNEGNPFEYYKYVFSTGSYIDSLAISGTIKDAILPTIEDPVSVLLYEVTPEFNDSIVYNQKPTYVTTIKDSTNTFEITNIKEGRYLLTALQEKNNDYTFQPQNDKVGYYKDLINIPTDSSFIISLFKERPSYTVKRPKHQGKSHITFGYEGTYKMPTVEMISPKPENYESTFYKDTQKDTIHYWYKPEIPDDSITFKVTHGNNIDTLLVRTRELYQDSLKIDALKRGTLALRDSLTLKANIPISAIDTSKIHITDKDTISVTTQAVLQKRTNTVRLDFDKKEDQKYNVQLLPGFIKDFFGTINDTITIGIKTKPISDYGSITLTLQNNKIQHPIVQITNEKFEVLLEKKLVETDAQQVTFEELNPGNYYIRVIDDENNNGIWDSGNYLKKIAPEKVTYYPTKINLRANFSLQETFILK